MTNRVDILLTYWGDFGLLKQSVESVVQQTETNWRLVIIDDCYPSNEAQKYFAKNADPRITYIRHAKNIGITKNFNYAIDLATADYCMLLGCDDILEPNYLEQALAKIDNADFYQPGVTVIDGDGNPCAPIPDRIKRLLRPRAGLHGGQGLAASLSSGNWLYFPSILWRTKTIQRYRFDEKYTIVEDVKLQLSIIRDGGTVYVDNEKTFRYRRFAQSLSSIEKKSGGVRFDEEADVYSYFSNEFSAIGWRRAAIAARFRVTSRLHKLLS